MKNFVYFGIYIIFRSLFCVYNYCKFMQRNKKNPAQLNQLKEYNTPIMENNIIM